MASTQKHPTEGDYIRFIRTVIDKYAGPLQLGHFTFLVQRAEENGYLSCLYRYPYNDGIIQFSEHSFEDWQSEPAAYHERKILHEMCHLLTDPLYSKTTTQFPSRSEVEDERERLTDHIAVVVFKLLGGEVQ